MRPGWPPSRRSLPRTSPTTPRSREELLSGLGELPTRLPRTVTDVRGVGLMIGVEFRTGEQAAAVQQLAFEHGLLVLECGESTIRMSPPLVITLEQAYTALRIFGDSVAAVAE